VDGARFDLAVPGDVRFGRGRVAEVPGALVALGVRRVLIVTGRSAFHVDGLRAELTAQGIGSDILAVAGEPTVDVLRNGLETARSVGCDGVLGYGGGSALDVAKAVAILAPHGTDPLEHLEVIGRGRPVPGPGLPCVAVPTTAGTGSEVTRNAVLAADGVKASLRSPLMLPRVAIVDPELLAGLGAGTIAAGGMDALAQLVEPYLTPRANPFTDALARDGLRRSARSLRRAVETGLDGDDEGTDESAAATREDLALASLFGGLCLANSGLGAVHGFAAVVGGRFDAPHGAVCAALLAPALDVNVRALGERAPGSPALLRAAEIAALLTGVPEASAADGVAWLERLRAALRIPGLGAYGMADADVPAVVAAAAQASSMRANPIALTTDELTEIARRAL
jgi:alcohol dehydrogenase class IV